LSCGSLACCWIVLLNATSLAGGCYDTYSGMDFFYDFFFGAC
jgi:hypothetical protein